MLHPVQLFDSVAAIVKLLSDSCRLGKDCYVAPGYPCTALLQNWSQPPRLIFFPLLVAPSKINLTREESIQINPNKSQSIQINPNQSKSTQMSISRCKTRWLDVNSVEYSRPLHASACNSAWSCIVMHRHASSCIVMHRHASFSSTSSAILLASSRAAFNHEASTLIIHPLSPWEVYPPAFTWRTIFDGLLLRLCS